MSALALAAPGPALPALDPAILATVEELEALRGFAENDVAQGTHAVYDRAVVRFERWHRARAPEHPPLPATAEMVALYISGRATDGRAYSTIAVELAALARWHHERGHESPTDDGRVQRTLFGIGRAIGREQHGKGPVLLPQLRALAAAVPIGARGIRLRAMILLCFYGALRRSELCALHAGDVARHEFGLLVHLRRSKSDQGGRGKTKAVPRLDDAALCPERALAAWLAVRGEHEGPLFAPLTRRGRGEAPHPATFAVMVKGLCVRAGLDPEGYGAHSFRIGWATEAARRGARVERIQAQLGHTTAEMSLRYVKAHEVWLDHPGARLF